MPHEPSRDRTDSLLEESVEDLYDHAPCGYLSTLPDGTIARVNQTLIDWTGFDRETLLAGTRFQALLTVGSRIYYETHYAPLLQMQGTAREIAFDVVRADGRILPVIANSVQKRSADGAVLFNRITVFDSTDRKRYERELLLARRRARTDRQGEGRPALDAQPRYSQSTECGHGRDAAARAQRAHRTPAASPSAPQVFLRQHAQAARTCARTEQGGVEQLCAREHRVRLDCAGRG